MSLRRLLVVPLFLLSIYLIFHLSRSVWGIYRRTDRVAELRAEVAALERERVALENERQYRLTAEYIEREARNRLNMVREGERILILPDGRDEEIPVSESQAPKTQEKPNWRKWVEYWVNRSRN